MLRASQSSLRSHFPIWWFPDEQAGNSQWRRTLSRHLTRSQAEVGNAAWASLPPGVIQGCTPAPEAESCWPCCQGLNALSAVLAPDGGLGYPSAGS